MTSSSNFSLVPGAAGASRLLLGDGTDLVVSEHRAWLDEVYGERAGEAPGVIKRIGADGKAIAGWSGWAMGPALADGSVTWLEERDDEYRYRVRTSKGDAAGALAPPDDFWLVAASVGHPAAPVGAVVLWRPAQGASPTDPSTRRDELWIAGVERATAKVVATTRVDVTLPDPRDAGVALGGTASKPLLLLIGLPAPGGRGAYRAVALTLPDLSVAWETAIDPELTTAMTPAPPPGPGVHAPPPATSSTTADTLRTFTTVRLAPLGDGSGWLLIHGTPLGPAVSATHVFVIATSGMVTPLPGLHVRDAGDLTPVVGRPAVALLGVAGGRRDLRFDAIEVVAPGAGEARTALSLQSKIGGVALGADVRLQPIAIAARGDHLLGAAALAEGGTGADRADVQGSITTPVAWHQPDRPRVKDRKAWLAARAKP
jgi:hypothetical protein